MTWIFIGCAVIILLLLGLVWQALQAIRAQRANIDAQQRLNHAQEMLITEMRTRIRLLEEQTHLLQEYNRTMGRL